MQVVYSNKSAECLGNAAQYCIRGTLIDKKWLKSSRYDEIQPVHLLLGILSVETELYAAFDAILGHHEIKTAKQLIDMLEMYFGINKAETPDLIEGEVIHNERLNGYPRPLLIEKEET